ncbi:MAG: hypothetical protein OXH72_11035 [Caldilineaceae bacterium]|nr:hypothetical protein [Caldilineaceae bacterium]
METSELETAVVREGTRSIAVSLPGHDVHLCYDVVGQQTIGVSGYQHDRILPAALAGLGKDNIDDSSVLYAGEPL